jgi:hypothetical protein
MAKWWMKTWICNVDELHDWHAMSVHLPRICLVERYAVIVHAADFSKVVYSTFRTLPLPAWSVSSYYHT